LGVLLFDRDGVCHHDSPAVRDFRRRHGDGDVVRSTIGRCHRPWREPTIGARRAFEGRDDGHRRSRGATEVSEVVLGEEVAVCERPSLRRGNPGGLYGRRQQLEDGLEPRERASGLGLLGRLRVGGDGVPTGVGNAAPVGVNLGLGDRATSAEAQEGCGSLCHCTGVLACSRTSRGPRPRGRCPGWWGPWLRRPSSPPHARGLREAETQKQVRRYRTLRSQRPPPSAYRRWWSGVFVGPYVVLRFW